MRRSSVAIGVLLLTTGGLTACSGDGGDDGARSLAQQLAGELAAAAAPEESAAPEGPEGSDGPDGSDGPEGSEGTVTPDRFATVPFDGTGSSAVAEEFAAIVDGMDGIVPEVGVDDVTTSDDTATATLSWTWPVAGEEDPWSYDTEVALVRSGGKWSVTWAPTVVEPSLEAGDVLDAVTRAPDRGDITGARGEVLVTERPVVRVGIDKTRIAPAAAPGAARELARATGIDVAAYVKTVEGAGAKAFVEAITYRQDEVPRDVQVALARIKGAHQVTDRLALAPTRDFAAPILGRVGPVTAEMVEEDPEAYRPGDVAGISGLQARYDERLRGSAGRVVHAVPGGDGTAGADGADGERRVLFEREPEPGRPLPLTLDQRLQALAERVLAGVEPAAALVAIRPSDGAILAAANGSGTDGQNHATFGRFAPGSTFKIVTSLALLRAGMDPTSQVRCTPTVTVDGKQFKNYSDYPSSSLGTIALQDAIAQSCNTALIDARGRLDNGDLAAAAATLGLGIDRDLGFPSYFGEVPDPASETEAAASLIGQGKVLASPMVMATVIASVQAGRTVVPHLVGSVDVPTAEGAAPLTPAEARALRGMLRRVVTDGSGRGLADVPGAEVIAKTGTAEYADGGTIRTHAWMVAAQGDLAVAVFVRTGESGSQTAGPLLEAFLRGR